MKISAAEYIKSLSLDSTIIWYSCELYNSNSCITIYFVIKKYGSCKQQKYTIKKQSAFTTQTDRFGASKDQN